MPFFMLTDGKIDLSLKSGVKTAISFGVKDMAPYFSFTPPTPFFETDSGTYCAFPKSQHCLPIVQSHYVIHMALQD